MKTITTKRFKKIVIEVIESMFYYPNNRRRRFLSIPEIKKLLKESDAFGIQVGRTRCFSYDEFVMRLGWKMMGDGLITCDDLEAWEEIMSNNKPLYNKKMTYREVIEQTIKEELFCD